MNNKQREYAISRATNAITSNNPLPDTIDWPTNKQIATAWNLPASIVNMYHFASVARNHLVTKEKFPEYIAAKKKYDAAVKRIKAKRDKLINEAKDFIMLGKEADVLKFLADLDN